MIVVPCTCPDPACGCVWERAAWIDVNAIAARWPAYAQGDEGRDDDREIGGEA